MSMPPSVTAFLAFPKWSEMICCPNCRSTFRRGSLKCDRAMRWLHRTVDVHRRLRHRLRHLRLPSHRPRHQTRPPHRSHRWRPLALLGTSAATSAAHASNPPIGRGRPLMITRSAPRSSAVHRTPAAPTRAPSQTTTFATTEGCTVTSAPTVATAVRAPSPRPHLPLHTTPLPMMGCVTTAAPTLRIMCAKRTPTVLIAAIANHKELRGKREWRDAGRNGTRAGRE